MYDLPMNWISTAIIATALTCACDPTANGLCIYKGKLYAKTTLAQEFKDSQWVVLVRVISASSAWPDNGDGWTLYKVETVQTFKGDPPRNIEVLLSETAAASIWSPGPNPT